MHSGLVAAGRAVAGAIGGAALFAAWSALFGPAPAGKPALAAVALLSGGEGWLAGRCRAEERGPGREERGTSDRARHRAPRRD